MALYTFSLGASESYSGTGGVADTFEVNSLVSFSTNDTAVATPMLEGGAIYDVLLFSMAGVSINLGSYNYISGIESHEFIDAAGFDISWNNGYAAANLGFGSVFYIGSTVGSNAASLSLNGDITSYPIQFSGAAGGDSLRGGTGADTAIGRDGNDTVLLFAGADSLAGNTGADCLMGGSGADTLFGGLGQDNMMGASGADLIYYALNDVAVSEIADGGDGSDTLRLDSLNAATYSFSDVSIYDVEVIRGDAYADNVVLNWSQVSDGGGSIVHIDLGGGTDKLTLLNVNGTLNFTSVSMSIANIESLTLGNSATFAVYAPYDQAFATVSTGALRMDYYGSTANDSVWGGSGPDNLYGHAGGDVIVARSGADYLFGNHGADTLFGGSSADQIFGNSGADILVGGAGGDNFYAHSGADTVFGGDGPDTVDDNGPDGAGIFVLADAAGDSGDDVVYGNAGADTLVGGLGNDLLAGHGAADVLIGGAGEDTLSGGYGVDVMWGEAGIDKFIFASGYGFDMIADFQPGVDKIQLSNFDAISTFGSFQAIAAINTSYGNAVIVTMAGGEQLSIIGAVGGLSATDFII